MVKLLQKWISVRGRREEPGSAGGNSTSSTTSTLGDLLIPFHFFGISFLLFLHCSSPLYRNAVTRLLPSFLFLPDRFLMLSHYSVPFIVFCTFFYLAANVQVQVLPTVDHLHTSFDSLRLPLW